MSEASVVEHSPKGRRTRLDRRHRLRSAVWDPIEEPPKSTKHGRTDHSEPCSPVSFNTSLNRTKETIESREAEGTNSEAGSSPTRQRRQSGCGVDKLRYRLSSALSNSSDAGILTRS